MKRKIYHSQNGFTLIELLIVVAIIAIISAIAVPQMLKAINLSKDKRALSQVRNIAVALGMYQVEFEMVPQVTNITDLIAALEELPDSQNVTLQTRDAWGNEFYYASPSSTEYTLKSLGKDGGESETANINYFDPNADIVVISGVFRASHQGTASVMGN